MFKTILGSIGIIAIVLLVIFILIYNKLVRTKNLLNESWNNINIQLKRRYDLVPNLIATIKNYSNHEITTLERVGQLRTIAMSANSIENKTKTEKNLTNGLKSLLAAAENHPDLKASHNFDNIQKELNSIQSQLKLNINYYNSANQNYNNAIASFPNNLVARILKYTPQAFFEINSI